MVLLVAGDSEIKEREGEIDVYSDSNGYLTNSVHLTVVGISIVGI